MTARPILFSAPMVRALLDGRKTQTRRVIKDAPVERNGYLCTQRMTFRDAEQFARIMPEVCPYGTPGDLLWVRETSTYWESPSPSSESITPRANESHRPADGKRYQRWMNRTMPQGEDAGTDFLVYKADGSKRSLAEWAHPHPIYEHCVGRFGKTVVAIHMHRWASRLTLRITDVRVERLQEISSADCIAEGIDPHHLGDSREEASFNRSEYSELWDRINGDGAWEANPWIWAISFDVLKQNVDAVMRAAA